MFEWVTDTANKVSDWFGGGGSQEQQKKSTPAPSGGGYQQQQQQLSPQNNTYEQQAKAQKPSGGGGYGAGIADWWNNLWGGDEDKDKGGASGESKSKPQGESIEDKRAREDKYYAAKWRLDQMKSNQASYGRYIERRDKWDAEYAKYKQDPYRNKMPAQIKPYTPPNPGVPDPTHPSFPSILAEQQAKVDKLKAGG